MEFYEHGQFTLTLLDPNRVFLDATGPFNKEAFRRYHQELKTIVEGFNLEPWHHVAVLRGESILIPEVLELYVPHLRWRASKMGVSDTIVLDGNLHPSSAKYQLEKLFNELNMPLFFADSVEQAIARRSF